MGLLKSNEEYITLCVCNKGGDECPIKEPENNMFGRCDEIDDCLEELGILPKAKGRRINESWEWDKDDNCILYYVLLYDNFGNRIRDQETILHRKTTCFNTTRSSRAVDCIRILALCKTTEEHGFVGIYRAHGLEDVKLVIDLSRMTNTNRESKNNSRRHIHFGFSCDGEEDFEDCTRIAVKRFLPGEDESETERTKRIHDQINLAILAGGQYTTKYLAASEIKAGRDIWIATEGCSLGTLDVFIDKGGKFRINHENVKICFKHILLGLNDMHSKSIIHGNMTLDNMLVWRDGKRLKIAEYDEMQRCHKGDDMESKIDKEIRMTAKMFYKCFKGNSKADMEEDEKPSSLGSGDDCESISDVNSMKHDGALPESWISRLRFLACGCFTGDCDAYLGAYLMIHMDMDKPQTVDILKHPFFWDEHKAMSFITRMDGYLYRVRMVEGIELRGNANAGNTSKRPETNAGKTAEESVVKSDGTRDAPDNRFGGSHDEMNVLKTILHRFRKAREEIDPDLSWVKTLKEFLKRRNSRRMRPTALNRMLTDIDEKEGQEEYISSDMTTFLRCIRNIHYDYMEPDVKFFDSDSDLLKFFNGIYPGMTCLLHRALWHERDNAHLPRDLRQFFVTPEFLETLDLLGQ